MRFLKFTIVNAIAVIMLSLWPMAAQGVITPNLQQRLDQSKSEEMIRINIRLSDQIDSAELTAKTAGITDKEQRRSMVVNELRSFAEVSQKDILAFLGSAEKNQQVTQIKSLWIVNLINCYATPGIIGQIAQLPGIERLDYDQMRKVIEETDPAPPVAPADKLGDKSNIAWNVSLVNAPEVWEQGYTGEGIIVAVLDTGVNASHQDLAGRMWTHIDYPNHGYNFVNNNYDTSDNQSHGTHCAGTVAGNGTAGTTTGIAPGATIMALKVLGDTGSGTEAGVWAAIEFSVEYGAHVMSLSLGWRHSWNPDRAAWRIAMENAMNAGVIAAVAAGNEGGWGGDPPPAQVRTPGDCPAPWTHPDQIAEGGNSAVVSVGSTTNTDAISGFSSKGPVTWQNIAPFNDYAYNPGTGLIIPDVVAPGSDILSLTHNSNTGYTVKSGTSMATPAVAGLMALMLEKNPNLTPQEISQILEETAVALSETKSNTFGSGRIDAFAAIEATMAGVVYADHVINDSMGNDDGFVNPGESVLLAVSFENQAEEAYDNVVAQISSESEFVTITQDSAELGSFEAGEIIAFEDIFAFEVSQYIPGNYEIEFVIHTFSSDDPEENLWRSSFKEMAHAPYLRFLEYTLDDSQYGNNDGKLDPGETATLTVEIENSGQVISDDITFFVNTESSWLTIHQQDPLDLQPLGPNETVSVNFQVSALYDTPPETTEEILFRAVTGVYEFESLQEIIIGKAPVYSEGNIPSTYNTSPSTTSEALEPGVLTVSLPEGAVVTSVDVEYQIVSTGGGWMSEQRSFIRCVSPGGEAETEVVQGSTTNSGGTVDYQRTGLTIANNVPQGEDLVFELHVFRTWGGSGSNTQYAYVPNNSWKVIVQYVMPKVDVTFRITNQIDEVVENATFELNDEVKITDEMGEVHFNIFPGSYTYSLSAENHKPVEMQSIFLSETSVVELEMIREFIAHFLIHDPDGNTPEGVVFRFDDQVLDDFRVTGLDNGLYSYSVEAEGYTSHEGSIYINNKDLELEVLMHPVYRANFMVYDEWGSPIDNAIITFEGHTQQAGMYEFDQLLAGQYDYTVSAEYFFDYHGSVMITDAHVDVEVIMEADGTSVDDFQSTELSVYPNPADRWVRMIAASQILEITITDMAGRVVFSDKVKDFETTVHTDFLQNGFYIIQAVTEEKTHLHKIQINR